jgi:hypothetical protein
MDDCDQIRDADSEVGGGTAYRFPDPDVTSASCFSHFLRVDPGRFAIR